jgi:hypothetical protein
MTRAELIEAMFAAADEARTTHLREDANDQMGALHAGIVAALAALEAHAAVVPREPTREMLQAMCDRRGIDGSKAPTDILDNAAIISMGESVADYRAMLSASPYAPEMSDE